MIRDVIRQGLDRVMAVEEAVAKVQAEYDRVAGRVRRLEGLAADAGRRTRVSDELEMNLAGVQLALVRSRLADAIVRQERVVDQVVEAFLAAFAQRVG